VSFSARLIVLIAALLPSAGATTITVLPADNMTQANAERNSWLSQNFGAGATANPIQAQVNNIGHDGAINLQLLTSLYCLYFLMSDVEGNIQIKTADGTTANVYDANNGFYFVGITSWRLLSIQWQSDHDFTLDNFGIPHESPPTPEPATWLCMATGLAAITLRCKVPSAPSPAAQWIWRSVKLGRLLRGARGPDSRARR